MAIAYRPEDEFPPELAVNYGAEPLGEAQAEGMSDDELEAIVEAEVQDAVSFIDSEIGKARADAIRFYRGEKLGNEEEGRSQFVSRDVADTISAIMPSLMRIFFGPEHVVEFVPEQQEDEAVAAQQTDYINYIVTRDNDGFEVFHAVLKNALREKVGFIKYWWDDSVEVRTRRYTGLDMDGLTKLLEDVDASLEAEIVEKEQREDGTLDVTLKLKRKVDRAKIAAVPPEEFLINRDAVSLDTARLVAHRRDMTVSDLVALGYDRELVEANAGQEDNLTSSDEKLARNPYASSMGRLGSSSDKSTATARYVEAYITVDHDGDGLAELMKVCTIGGKVVHKEAVDERPFADFHTDPEPHTFFGESIADKTKDIQLLKSSLIRSGLDSLGSSIFPRLVVGPGVNTDDVLNNEVGAVIRSTSGAAEVQAIVTPDVSPAALTWLGYADQVRENRTGMSKVSMGLDAESLQNTTATAAEGQFSRSQERIELIARIMASGFRRLFRGLSHLVAANQREARMVQLRNQWVEIDPRAWRSDMDVQPNVGLGGGTDAHKASVLSQVMQTQAAIFTQYGLQNPFVSVRQYLETAGAFLELAGFKAANKFFNDPAQAEEMMAQQAAAQANQPPPEDPKVIEAKSKAMLSAQESEAKVAQTARDAEIAHEQAIRKIDGDLAIAEMTAARKMDLEERQVAAELELKARTVETELALKAQVNAAQIAMKQQATAEAVSDVEPGGEPG
jgi:hypothetical protein